MQIFFKWNKCYMNDVGEKLFCPSDIQVLIMQISCDFLSKTMNGILLQIMHKNSKYSVLQQSSHKKIEIQTTTMP